MGALDSSRFLTRAHPGELFRHFIGHDLHDFCIRNTSARPLSSRFYLSGYTLFMRFHALIDRDQGGFLLLKKSTLQVKIAFTT